MHDDGETGHGRNIHQAGEDAWGAEACEWLLRLRFGLLRERFDHALSVAAVHEAWGLVAQRLNGALRLGVNAVECSDQLSRLRAQWETQSSQMDARLAQQMAESFGTDAEPPPTPAEVLEAASLGITSNRAKEMTDVEEVEEIEEPPRKKQATEQLQTEQPGLVEMISMASYLPDVRGLPRAADIVVALERRAILLERRDQLQQQENELTQQILDAVAVARG